MLKKIFFILLSISILFFSFSIIKIEKKIIIPKITLSTIKKVDHEIIGELVITKINLYQKLYAKDSPKNNVEENVTILEPSTSPDQENSIIILAAHSGDAYNSYFQNLDQLEIKDEILLVYKNKKYYYEVKEIWEEKKNGYINVNKNKENQLILTTCSPNKENYQLVINCIKKESI